MSGKSSVGGRAAVPPCLGCDGGCSGFQPHPWRKSCTACGCSTADHAPTGSDPEDDQRMGRLLADSPSAHLTAKVKGAGGLRVYKRNRVTVTNPLATGKDPDFDTLTYDWAPAGKLAVQYMELLPEDQRPVAGSHAALRRRRQLLRQLPFYDQDPMKCRSLASEQEISSMLLFVQRYKREVLGVGEVALPGEASALLEAAAQRTAKETAKETAKNTKDGRKDRGGRKDTAQHQDQDQDISSLEPSAGAPNGTEDQTQHLCSGCHGEVAMETPAVFAERAGYHGYRWHPACFVCAACGDFLVDLVYFWSDHKLLCGRHFCQSVQPRCCGCDELIFCEDFVTAADGRTFHEQHDPGQQ
ncbi:LIM and cysteine-rich domains protein 1-like [Cololabis saira]|uniref:LIM and cysteine-rich domains protein 1-like n=1 Tax=Cololabis saira TaxID=129043 RepID=UPI002AD49238|nr:LIM and cysteine-rich domains protein 1-like [Cololabis saira]XP_061582525.1 LIM and cysteine-rich domains protein 1-like [Cololabis saira]XP_061582526.1 LIM and cysteine-rich domains protein 1-like [Cololabis saira]